MKYVVRLFRSKHSTRFCLQEQVSKQIAILFKDAPDLRSDFRVFIPDRSQQPMDGPAHTSTQDRHRRKLDAVANSFTHSSLPQKRKRKAAEKEREREKEAAKNAPPTKVCGWYPLTNHPYLFTLHRKRNTLRTSHLCRTILNMLQAHPPLVELPIILCRGHLLLTMKLISLIE
jgi:histone deacetylase complex regulatory component SIN3